MRRRLFASGLLAATVAVAQPQPPDRVPLEEGSGGKPWEEQKTRLPPYPKPENWVPIYVSPATTFEFFVDRASVSVGQDGVVRYTLVARSSSGATNVGYEGIRCQTFERKLYAFGRFDGAWSQARDPRWVRISRGQANRQHAALAEDFFCYQQGGPVRTSEEAVQALQRGNQIK